MEDLLPLPTKLNDDEFFILGLITYLDSGLQEITMNSICKRRDIKKAIVDNTSKTLNHLGLTSLGSRYWAPFGNTYPQYYFAVTLRLLNHYPEYVTFFEKLSTKPSGIYEFLWRASKAIHTQDPRPKTHLRPTPFSQLDTQSHPLSRATLRPQGVHACVCKPQQPTNGGLAEQQA